MPVITGPETTRGPSVQFEVWAPYAARVDMRLGEATYPMERDPGRDGWWLVEAAAALKPRYPEARFLIVGETSPHDRAYLHELVALAERLRVADRVIFAGLRSDVPALLVGFHVTGSVLVWVAAVELTFATREPVGQIEAAPSEASEPSLAATL